MVIFAEIKLREKPKCSKLVHPSCIWIIITYVRFTFEPIFYSTCSIGICPFSYFTFRLEKKNCCGFFWLWCKVKGVRLSVCRPCGIRAREESDLGLQNTDRCDLWKRSCSPLTRLWIKPSTVSKRNWVSYTSGPEQCLNPTDQNQESKHKIFVLHSDSSPGYFTVTRASALVLGLNTTVY